MLVMLAGSIVRMTGSGMGCPDWPKCFGYTIPPTERSTLIWKPERKFEKGHMIIRDEALFVAKRSFTSSELFDPNNWEPYTKHDYAIFNPFHTWVEFLNRLIGAFTGLPVLALALFSLRKIKSDPLITIAAILGVILLGFEAWLGKLVVDGNLVPNQITLHMFGALGLVALFTFIVVRLGPSSHSFRPLRSRRLMIFGIAGIFLLLAQIFFGTKVRERVDEIGKAELQEASNQVEVLSVFFEVHRTFSLLVIGVLGFFAIQLIRTRLISTWPRILLILLIAEVLAGMGLAYLGMPDVLQPVHLMFAVFNFSLALFLVLTYFRRTSVQGAH
jgi:cytochrome c oxidase assembly protein subunit 15